MRALGSEYLRSCLIYNYFLINFLILLLALYYVTFQCGCKNISIKLKKKIFGQKKLKKPPQNVAYLWQLEVFFLCSPNCPKQPRTSFPFYKFFYPTISGRISVWDTPWTTISRQNLAPCYSRSGFSLIFLSKNLSPLFLLIFFWQKLD